MGPFVTERAQIRASVLDGSRGEDVVALLMDRAQRVGMKQGPESSRRPRPRAVGTASTQGDRAGTRSSGMVTGRIEVNHGVLP